MVSLDKRGRKIVGGYIYVSLDKGGHLAVFYGVGVSPQYLPGGRSPIHNKLPPQEKLKVQ